MSREKTNKRLKGAGISEAWRHEQQRSVKLMWGQMAQKERSSPVW